MNGEDTAGNGYTIRNGETATVAATFEVGGDSDACEPQEVAYQRGYQNGFKEGQGEFSYQNENRRHAALSAAVQYMDKDRNPDAVVNAAEKFLAFLEGKGNV